MNSSSNACVRYLKSKRKIEEFIISFELRKILIRKSIDLKILNKKRENHESQKRLTIQRFRNTSSTPSVFAHSTINLYSRSADKSDAASTNWTATRDKITEKPRIVEEELLAISLRMNRCLTNRLRISLSRTPVNPIIIRSFSCTSCSIFNRCDIFLYIDPTSRVNRPNNPSFDYYYIQNKKKKKYFAKLSSLTVRIHDRSNIDWQRFVLHVLQKILQPFSGFLEAVLVAHAASCVQYQYTKFS